MTPQINKTFINTRGQAEPHEFSLNRLIPRTTSPRFWCLKAKVRLLELTLEVFGRRAEMIYLPGHAGWAANQARLRNALLEQESLRLGLASLSVREAGISPAAWAERIDPWMRDGLAITLDLPSIPDLHLEDYTPVLVHYRLSEKGMEVGCLGTAYGHPAFVYAHFPHEAEEETIGCANVGEDNVMKALQALAGDHDLAAIAAAIGLTRQVSPPLSIAPRATLLLE